jgi:hypothetical protein
LGKKDLFLMARNFGALMVAPDSALGFLDTVEELGLAILVAKRTAPAGWLRGDRPGGC